MYIFRYLSQLAHTRIETKKIIQNLHSGKQIISITGTGHLLIKIMNVNHKEVKYSMKANMEMQV